MLLYTSPVRQGYFAILADIFIEMHKLQTLAILIKCCFKGAFNNYQYTRKMLIFLSQWWKVLLNSYFIHMLRDEDF